MFSSCRFQSTRRALKNVRDGFVRVAERDLKLRVYLATRTCAVNTFVGGNGHPDPLPATATPDKASAW